MTPAQLERWLRAAGGRRFVLSVGCGIVSTVVLALGLIGEASYVQLILGTVAAFVAGASWRQDVTSSSAQSRPGSAPSLGKDSDE